MYEFKQIGNDLLIVKFFGDIPAETIREFAPKYIAELSAIRANADVHGHKLKAIIYPPQGKVSALEARRLFAKTTADPRQGKIAVIGVTSFTKVMVRFVLTASGKTHIRLFDSEREALGWLDVSVELPIE